MHVLLLALNYYPDKLGNAPLMTGMAEGLVARGHQVTVVCAFPHHETGRIDDAYRGKALARETRNGVRILRTYIYAPEGGAVAKMANYASFTATAFMVSQLVREVDVIFTPSPPLTLGLVDYALSRMRRVPFVYNLQDLFPEAAVRLGVLTNPQMIAAFERLEAFVYRKAHTLSVISEGFRSYLLDKGVPDDKIAVIPNYTDTDFIQPRPQAGNPFRKAHGLEDAFVVQFSGRMGYSQGLETVVEAWRLLADLPALRLMMVGDGQARPMIDRELGDDARVIRLPVQPREVLPDLLAAADVGLAPLRHGMAGTSVPSKMFGIMAAGRAIIAGVDAGSDAEALIHTARCGHVVPPEDPKALAAAIRAAYEDRALTRQQGENARAHVVAEHSHKVVVDRYEAMLQAVVESR
ncbi:MAG: glycosyltransferase family 4 protein [Myxococcales bacterium]|nr:glycosyltransferase family 4 protein [Myxococcales bacterium]MCB9525011.1 glycosyltransferase family 4 protein [Myxococcales bacterium]